MSELDPNIIARLREKARADRALVDAYNASLLRQQGIEPTAERLQRMCDENSASVLAAAAQQALPSNN